jgi:hypothetical protein
MKTFSVTVKSTVSIERVACLLASALEGGSNYWYVITDEHAPTSVEYRTAISDEDDETTDVVYTHIDYPLNPGGYLMIGDKEDDCIEAKLDLEAVERGLQVMATDFPAHFEALVNEHDDAETGDVFLQCCLFGEVVYG